MSKFVTIIPTDIAEVIEKLPPGSYIHSITLNADRTIAIVWDHDKHKTPYTFPLECPVEKLDEISGKKPLEKVGWAKTIEEMQTAEPRFDGQNAQSFNVTDKVKVDKRTKEYKESLRNAQNPA